MKILFCNYEYPPLGGGGGVVMGALARHLARRHEVTVLTSRGLDLPAESIEGGVRVCRVPVWFRRRRAVANLPSMLAYLPSGLMRGSALVRGEPFDVINTHFVVPTGPVGHLLSRFYGLPNVLSVHGGDLYDPSKRLSPHRHAPLRSAVRALLNGADVLVGQSHDTVRRVREIYGVARGIQRVPLGIERPRLNSPALRQNFGLPEKAFVAVTVGRLVARKNTTALIRMLSSPQLRDVHLAIVGDGPQGPAIDKLAHELGVAGRVHRLGVLNETDKYRALCVANAFVSASRHEGFGMVFLEAMACGLPIACYDRGGQTDFLEDGKTGHVIALDDARAMTAAIARLRDDLASRLAMGRYNQSRVEEFFIDTCAARYEQIFAAAIDPFARDTLVRPRMHVA